MKFAVLASMAALTSAYFTEDRCCEQCPSGKSKYYSIVESKGLCGESCIMPEHYWIYKLLEHGLTEAKTNTPCADNDYPHYTNTDVHEFLNIKASVDFFDKKSGMAISEVEQSEESEKNSSSSSSSSDSDSTEESLPFMQ